MITILGKSAGVITMILDNLESVCDFQPIAIINNLKIEDSIPYKNKLFNIFEESEPVFGGGGVLLGVYNPKEKSDVIKLFKVELGDFRNAIHKSAQISSVAELGRGVIVCSSVSIAAYVKLGNYVSVDRDASFGCHTIIEDFVTISQAATICGNVKIGMGSYIGAGAVIIDGVTIGENVVVGAGSVVVKNVSDGYVVVGNPSNFIKHNQNKV